MTKVFGPRGGLLFFCLFQNYFLGFSKNSRCLSSSGWFPSCFNSCLVPSPLLEQKDGSRVPQVGVGWLWWRGGNRDGSGSVTAGSAARCVLETSPRSGAAGPVRGFGRRVTLRLSSAPGLSPARQGRRCRLRGAEQLSALAQTLEEGSGLKCARVHRPQRGVSEVGLWEARVWWESCLRSHLHPPAPSPRLPTAQALKEKSRSKQRWKG